MNEDIAETLRKTHGPDVVVLSKRAFDLITEKYNLQAIFSREADGGRNEQATRVHLGKIEMQPSHGLSWYLGPKPDEDTTPSADE